MRSYALLIAAPLALAALSGCARTETPEEARAAAQAAQAEYDRIAAATRARNPAEEDVSTSPGQIDTSRSARLTPGEWSIVQLDGERAARFGEEGQPARITIACEIGGGIDIRLIGLAPQGGSETVYISSPAGGSTFTASDTIADAAEAYISVPASDPFIGRLISGNGPFTVRMGSDQRIIFPAGDALTSVVSSCDRRDSDVSADGGEVVTTTTGQGGDEE